MPTTKQNPGAAIKQKTRLHDHLVFLAGTIGERPTGSERNRQAAQYIGETLSGLRYDMEFQNFPIGEWNAARVQLTCGDLELHAEANPYSPACNCTAELVTAGTLSELETADITGKILLAHNELTKEYLMPRNFRFYHHDEHCRIVQLMEEKKAAAVITVCPRSDQPVHVIIDGDFPVPSCTVTAPEGAVLLKNAGKQVLLRIDATTMPAVAANVIGRSGDRSGKKIVLCAHFDTKFSTPGALDNATGAAVLLELARVFHEQPVTTGLEFVFFNGEECYCAPGECAYLDAGYLIPARVLLGINVDGAGLAGSPVGISWYGCPDILVADTQKFQAQYPGIDPMDPWPQGDHMIFFMHQIPCIAISTKADPAVIARIIHSENDTLEGLDEEKIQAVIDLTERIIRQVAGTSKIYFKNIS
ncbi:M28 family peptidase [Methanoregula sp.]|uniref:M28 family peptidase n=1 Tax=Methanoregula sp. TaxID=2052170 RepID=UPI0035617CDB